MSRRSPLFALAAAMTSALAVLPAAADAARPSASGSPKFTGTPTVGTPYAASPATWKEGNAGLTFAHQWLSCDADGAACTPIDTADATDDLDLTPRAADLGRRLKVRVTATNGDGSGSVTSTTASPAVTPRSRIVTPGRILGDPYPYDGFTLVPAVLEPAINDLPREVRWFHCAPTGDECQDTGRTGSELGLFGQYFGRRLEARETVQTPDGPFTAASARTALLGFPFNVEPPTVVAKHLEPGDVLHADDGSWKVWYPGQTNTRAWLRCPPGGAACVVAEEGSESYTITQADRGSRFRLRVTFSNDLGSLTKTSAQTRVIGAPTVIAPPVLSAGDLVPGTTLTATQGRWSGQNLSFTQGWTRCGADGGGCTPLTTASSYTITDADLGKVLRFAVTAKNDLDDTTSKRVTGVVGAPQLKAAKVAGRNWTFDTLRAELTFFGRAVPASDTTYQWQRCYEGDCRDIPGATGSSYATDYEDQGDLLQVVVRASNAHGALEEVVEGPPIVQGPLDVKTPSELLTTGVVRHGSTLEARRATFSGPNADKYPQQATWVRCTSSGTVCKPIPGARARDYLLTADDVGHKLRYRTTTRTGGGETVSDSAPTQLVRAADGYPIPDFRPTIERVAGGGLRVNDSWQNNPTSYAYSWRICEYDEENDRYGCDREVSTDALFAEADPREEYFVVVTATNAKGRQSIRSGSSYGDD